jgi:protein-arginine kinase activator protein McsA
MTAAYRVVIAELKDIPTVTVVCDECACEISLNLDTSRMPEGCAACSKQWSDNIKNALAGLARFRRMGKTAEEAAGKPIFRFQIKQAE